MVHWMQYWKVNHSFPTQVLACTGLTLDLKYITVCLA